MARKVLSRKDLRAEAEAAEAMNAQQAPVKKPPTKKLRAKAAKEVRMKAYWGVYNQSMKRVALFEYADRTQAEKKAEDLTASHKTPHFIQPVKEAIQE